MNVTETGEYDELDSILHHDVHVSDVSFDGAYVGIPEYIGHVENLRNAFSDIETSYTILAEGTDSVTVEWRLEGVHSGPFMGVEATDNDVSFGGIDVFSIEDGRVKKIRTAFDVYRLLTDMGAVSLSER